MNIHYHCSDYISHQRAGAAYMACLNAMGHVLVDDPGRSDVVILHEEPFRYAATMAVKRARPGGKYIGYAVWETPELPRRYAEGVSRVDAVWTCSEFSRRAFAPYAETRVLPHVVERLRPAAPDLAWARDRLGMRGSGREHGSFYFYTIVDTVNPRKDVKTLLTAFAATFPGGRDGTRLVVKQYREAQRLDQIPGVIDIPEMLTDGQLAALHAVCDCYVSAHHAEAWGLPLSEAMSIGNPVIATGYSGNMEFMTPENSFPVAYTRTHVSERMCLALPDLFSPEMTWADIDAPDLMRIMRLVRSRPPGMDFRSRVALSMKAFSPAATRERLATLLEKL